MHQKFKDEEKIPNERVITEETEKHFRRLKFAGFVVELFYQEEKGKKEKVGDPCNLAEKFREPANTYGIPNVKQKFWSSIPIFLHIMTKYDLHLFFKELKKQIDKSILSTNIPKAAEKCKTNNMIAQDWSIL